MDLRRILRAGATAAALALALPAAAQAACPNAGIRTAGLASADGPHVRVWHRPRDRAAARAYLTAIEGRIWPRFRTLLGRTPPRDGGVTACANGRDGRLDLYVVRAHRDLRGGRVAAFRPYSGEPCDPRRPGIVVLRRGVRRAVVAHELFHAFQAAFGRATACINYSEWDEATATWAMDHAYPRDQDEHVHRGNRRLEYPIAWDGYGGWLYVTSLVKRHGTRVVRRLHEAQGRLPEIPALDAAVPGGAAKSFQEYAALAWNADPLPGTSVGPSFLKWDRYGTPGGAVVPVDASLQGRATRVVPLTEGIRTRATDVRRIVVPADVRWLGIRPGVEDDPDGRVGAFVRIGSEWRYEDWTGRRRVSFCRDLPSGDVREVILLTTNAVVGAPEPLRPQGAVEAARACLPREISGTFSGDFGPRPPRVTWNGQVTFTYLRTDLQGHVYEAAGGSVGWTGTQTGGCTGSGSGSVAFPGFTAQLIIKEEPREDGAGWDYQMLGVPAPSPQGDWSYTVICGDDPPQPRIANDALAAGQGGGEGALLYNGFVTGQPEANRFSADLTGFSGQILTPFGNQRWEWALTGRRGELDPLPERPAEGG